jgi:hypothetical protein
MASPTVDPAPVPAKHTPGPWRINRKLLIPKNTVLIDAERHDGMAARYAIAFLRKDFEHTEANAQLIAQAPALLEAATVLVDAYRYAEVADPKVGDAPIPDLEAYVVALEAAIAAAKGE